MGDAVYREVVEEVVSAYWRDYEDHKDDFVPAFLTNDILRLWRTFCVNYESGTDREPPEKKAKGKLKNFKLKHSRMLTCYSAILFLLNEYALNSTVTPDSVVEMTKLTPTMRLEHLRKEPGCEAAHNSLSSTINSCGQLTHQNRSCCSGSQLVNRARVTWRKRINSAILLRKRLERLVKVARLDSIGF